MWRWVALAERFSGMLPWEAKARTLEAPVDEVMPFMEMLRHEAEVASATAGFGPNDIYVDEWDPTCRICGGVP